MNPTATVAIVGRPNVGKSTLFNRLVGRRQAIVHDLPGVTRDRLVARATLDDESVIHLIDTGGLVPGDDPLGLNAQVLAAVGESDLLLLMVDGREGLVSSDEAVWAELRPLGKPAILVVNKADTHAAQERFNEFYRLGIDPQLLLSAEHGRGINPLREAITEAIPEMALPEVQTEDRIAIVGRPNVGKSSLVNRLLGNERVLVSPIAGTTRDPIDSVVRHEGRDYLLVDTAGIRRRSRTSGAAEELAVLMAERQIERAAVAVLVIDASQGVTSGDLAIAGSIWGLGRAAVVAVNKWDLLDEHGLEALESSFERLDEVLARPPRINLSALTGRGLERIWSRLDAGLEGYRTELSTAEVNRIFEGALVRHRPPLISGKPWKVYYATQVATGPPTFILFANRTLKRSHTYRRYLENRLREALDLPGVPLRLVVRKR